MNKMDKKVVELMHKLFKKRITEESYREEVWGSNIICEQYIKVKLFGIVFEKSMCYSDYYYKIYKSKPRKSKQKEIEDDFDSMDLF